MKIYVGHSTSFDFKEELYSPIKALQSEHEFVLPHEGGGAPSNSVELMKEIGLMIAEVSYPSTGLGIELGWADQLGVKIVCIHKTDTNPSPSIATICKQVYSYANTDELKVVLSEMLKS
jgi:hypothetical protein